MEFKGYWLRGINVLTEHILQSDLRHLDAAPGESEAAKTHFHFKRTSYMYVRNLLYEVLSHCFRYSGENYKIQLAVRIWTDWINPWDSLQKNDDDEPAGSFMDQWRPFLADNLPYYSMILRHFLEKSRELGFEMDKVRNGLSEAIPGSAPSYECSWKVDCHMIHRALKAYVIPGVVEELEHRENLYLSDSVIPRDHMMAQFIRNQVNDVLGDTPYKSAFVGMDKSLPVSLYLTLRDVYKSKSQELRRADPQGRYHAPGSIGGTLGTPTRPVHSPTLFTTLSNGARILTGLFSRKDNIHSPVMIRRLRSLRNHLLDVLGEVRDAFGLTEDDIRDGMRVTYGQTLSRHDFLAETQRNDPLHLTRRGKIMVRRLIARESGRIL